LLLGEYMLHYTELLACTGILSAPETGSAGLGGTDVDFNADEETTLN
jgi:hypothetical protein